jgi:hypothetical protein
MITVVDSKNGYFCTRKIDARSNGLFKEKTILYMIAGKNLENRTIVMDRGYVTLGLVKRFYVLGKIKKFQERNSRKMQRDRESNK